MDKCKSIIFILVKRRQHKQRQGRHSGVFGGRLQLEKMPWWKVRLARWSGIVHVRLGMPGGAIDTILQAQKNQWNFLSTSFHTIFLVLWKLECKGIYRKEKM